MRLWLWIAGVWERIYSGVSEMHSGMIRAVCDHAYVPEYVELRNVWGGKVHETSLWQCPHCGEVLEVKRSHMYPEGEER